MRFLVESFDYAFMFYGNINKTKSKQKIYTIFSRLSQTTTKNCESQNEKVYSDF